jgi:hypothetical protein
MALTELKTAASALLERFRFANMAGLSFSGRRDLYQILGYARQLTFFDYYDRYTRDGIAKAVVESFPLATWRGGVELYEDEDPDTFTEFEQAWKDLEDRLQVWSTLQTVDILAGLSTYAVLLIGNGEPDLGTEMSKGGKVLFLKPFSGGGGPGLNQRTQARSTMGFDAAARVATYDTDPKSERFGEPLTYWIKQVTVNTPMFNREVHWSRLIHIAEGCLEDNIFGIPTLENVWNLFDDLAKITGGGAESFWLRANQGLHLDVDKDMGLPGQTSAGLTKAERDALRDKAEELQHQLQRVMVTRGVTATQLGSDVANFGPSADAIIKQIAGSKGIPMRILTGSESGELASSMDAANFDSRVNDRRTGYAGPKIARRLADRLIAYEMVPTPKQYTVGWPVEENMDEKGKAGFAVQLASVNQTYGGVVFTDEEIRDMAFDKPPLTDEQKQAIADEKAQKVADAQAAMVAAQPPDPNAPDLNAPDPADAAFKTAETLRALEEAIEADDMTGIAAILELTSA